MRSCDYYMMVGVRGYDRMTMKEKRNAINNNLKAFQKSEKYKKYNGFAPIELLKENICLIMGWVRENTVNCGRHTRSYVYEDTDCEKVKKTIQHMVEQGYIEISKTGNGFRVLRTDD